VADDLAVLPQQRVHPTEAVLPVVLGQLADVLVYLGEWGEAEARCLEASGGQELADFPHLLILGPRERILIARGELERARELLDQADLGRSTDRQSQAAYLLMEAALLGAEGRSREALAMATRIGARAVHLGGITGSIEPGKRADLIVVDLDQAHNVPRFARDPGAVYSQLVYAAKSTDVVDVICNGRWLMRDRALLTLDEDELREAAREQAKRVDLFLTSREVNVLQKLVAVGGAVEQESFEVQVKARIAAETAALAVLASKQVTVVRSSHYHQYDTYWSFDDPEQGWLRFREDEFLDKDGNVTGGSVQQQ